MYARFSMKRNAAQTIWRTVVVAGAMLGAPACSKAKPAPTTPSNTQKPDDPAKADPAKQNADGKTTPDPCAGERVRGADDGGGGGVGRGFILS